jgi:hypothetical protein
MLDAAALHTRAYALSTKRYFARAAEKCAAALAILSPLEPEDSLAVALLRADQAALLDRHVYSPGLSLAAVAAARYETHDLLLPAVMNIIERRHAAGTLLGDAGLRVTERAYYLHVSAPGAAELGMQLLCTTANAALLGTGWRLRGAVDMLHRSLAFAAWALDVFAQLHSSGTARLWSVEVGFLRQAKLTAAVRMGPDLPAVAAFRPLWDAWQRLERTGILQRCRFDELMRALETRDADSR